MGQLRQGSKSDLMECLTKSSQPASIPPGIDANVLDEAAIVHMVRPGACRTFEFDKPRLLNDKKCARCEHLVVSSWLMAYPVCAEINNVMNLLPANVSSVYHLSA